MVDPKENRPLEEKIVVVDDWFYAFDAVARKEFEMAPIEQELLQEVLTHFGADFEAHDSPERTEALKKLKQSTNKWRRPGMDAVWGEGYMSNYNRWTETYADEYEEQTGKKLPRLEISKTRVSGMRHWLGELTAYAAGAITFEQYQERSGARLRNGYARATGGKLEEATFLADEKRFPGSIPPGFVGDAWEKVKSRTLKNPE